MTLPQLESKLARGGGKSLTKKHTVGNWEVYKKNNLNGVKDFKLKAKAKVWLRLSYLCHIRSSRNWCPAAASAPPNKYTAGNWELCSTSR